LVVVLFIYVNIVHDIQPESLLVTDLVD